MKPKLNVARALGARFARRVIRLATIIAALVLLALVLLTCVLVYFFSPWWWLLLVPIAFLAGISLVVRIVATIIASTVYSGRLNDEQTKELDEFVDTVIKLIESKSIPLPIFVMICIKDLLIHRDLRTARDLVRNSAALFPKYLQLEKSLHPTAQDD